MDPQPFWQCYDEIHDHLPPCLQELFNTVHGFFFVCDSMYTVDTLNPTTNRHKINGIAVHASCFCALLLRPEIDTPRHAWERALSDEMNNLGRSLIPTFLSRSRFYFRLPPYCPKMNKKPKGEVKKNSRFRNQKPYTVVSRKDVQQKHKRQCRKVLWVMEVHGSFIKPFGVSAT